MLTLLYSLLAAIARYLRGLLWDDYNTPSLARHLLLWFVVLTSWVVWRSVHWIDVVVETGTYESASTLVNAFSGPAVAFLGLLGTLAGSSYLVGKVLARNDPAATGIDVENVSAEAIVEVPDGEE